MTRNDRSGGPGLIRGIATGVPGFDAVLGGGLPEYSFNLIAGSPGTGKTTLAQQIVFANATVERPALYFTVLGEPTIKMLRYQQEFAFFDRKLVGSAVHYLNLSEEVLELDLRLVLDRIVEEVERTKPGIVVVDSFRTISLPWEHQSADTMSLDQFVQRLSLHLTSWEVTSFLLGEYAEREQRNPVFTVADGVFWLTQVPDRNSVVRKVQVMKVRGRAPMPGLHTFRMTDNGLQIFPRIPQQEFERRPQSLRRLHTGVPGLDEIMGGGIPAGDALILAGPAGSGKTTFATQFVAEGLRNGESAIIVVFEEYLEEYLARANARNDDIGEMIREGRLKLIYLRPLDLSVDETLAEILEGVQKLGAERVVIDSLSGFEVALAPAFREDFRESLYRLVGALTATGVTVFMTVETTGAHLDTGFTTDRVSFITDDIIVQRLIEIDGELRRVLAVVKMRGSDHSHEFRTFEVTAKGAVVGEPLKNYRGIMSGMPELRLDAASGGHAGLTDRETALLDTLVRLGGATPEALAVRLGLASAEVAATLERLQSLGYAALTKKGGRTYRAVAQPSG
ncbi:MAG TPA: ATPase domain-containing protein [Gemmatimonadaceae bacterium]|nr:ATPase domain-containing protein [Gemmatimonadaceae bacterium]